jgi:hypothetical protein
MPATGPYDALAASDAVLSRLAGNHGRPDPFIAGDGGHPALELVAPPEPGADLVEGIQVALDDLGGEGTEDASAGADLRPLGTEAGPSAEADQA